MSVLFYRRPDYLNPPSGPINSSECALYVERAKSKSPVPEMLPIVSDEANRVRETDPRRSII